MEPTLDVRFYRSHSGAEPVRDWLMSLDKPSRRAIGVDIKTVQFGWPLGMPLIRKLGPGLWEVRSHMPQGIARVLFTTRGRVLVLLHGFIKKSPRTPASDLDLALQRAKEVSDEH
jgi:phage-related protein